MLLQLLMGVVVADGGTVVACHGIWSFNNIVHTA